MWTFDGTNILALHLTDAFASDSSLGVSSGPDEISQLFQSFGKVFGGRIKSGNLSSQCTLVERLLDGSVFSRLGLLGAHSAHPLLQHQSEIEIAQRKKSFEIRVWKVSFYKTDFFKYQ